LRFGALAISRLRIMTDIRAGTPKTGEIVNEKPKKLPFFKVGKELKERVNFE